MTATEQLAGAGADGVLLFDVDDAGIATITLNRPDKLNIYNLEMRDALIDALDAVHAHPDARVLLLRANGRHFSAGADLREFGTADFPLEARRIRWDRDPWTPLWDLPVPSIVALHGYAVGAGIEMAMLCDLRFAARDTVVGLPEVTLGMLPAAGGTQSLARVIGPDRALPLVLLGNNIDAPEALRRGIVHDVVDDVETRARETARYLAGLDHATLAPVVRALRAAIDGHGRL